MRMGKSKTARKENSITKKFIFMCVWREENKLLILDTIFE